MPGFYTNPDDEDLDDEENLDGDEPDFDDEDVCSQCGEDICPFCLKMLHSGTPGQFPRRVRRPCCVSNRLEEITHYHLPAISAPWMGPSVCFIDRALIPTSAASTLCRIASVQTGGSVECHISRHNKRPK